ncbi:hypothetical protein, partial [Larkinella harenae]
PGEKIKGFSLLVTCKRDPEKDLILSLQTDRGSFSSKVSSIDPVASGKEMPIGTVISSFLRFDQFSVATKNNEKSPGNIWTSQKSKWAPCDGRSIPNSKLSSLANIVNAPDYRGLFLRGINSIDPTYTVLPAIPSQLNPDPQPVGVYQPDAVSSHKHKISNSKNVLRYIENSALKGGNGGSFMSAIGVAGKGNGELLVTDNDGGGNETRPKSAAIYYYIKIN